MENNVRQFELFDLEKTYLISCLIDRSLFVDYQEHIKIEYFKNTNIGLIFKFWKLYFEKYSSLPSLDRVNSVFRKKEYKEEIFNLIKDIYDPENKIEKDETEALRDDLDNFIKEEKLTEAILDGAAKIEEAKDKDKDERKKIYSGIDERVKEAVLWDNKIDFGLSINEVDRVFNQIEDLYTDMIPTPWPKLNQVIGGGLFRKELVCFTSNSSVGKTIALDNLAWYAWYVLGLNVVSITMEISEVRKAMRMYSSLTKLKTEQLLQNKDKVTQAFESIGERGNKLYIKEYPIKAAGAKDFEKLLYQLKVYKNLQKIHLLIIDYMDITKPNAKKTGNTYIDQGEIAEDERALAKLYDCVVATGSQLRRECVTMAVDDITEANVGDSHNKQKTLDTHILLHNTPEQRENGEILWKILKARSGIKDVVQLKYVDYPHLTIFE